MLAFFRKLTQSRITWIVLGIPLVGSLLLIGNVRQNLAGMLAKDAVVSTGSRIISSADYKRAFDSSRQRAQQQGQPPPSIEEIVAQGGDQQILSGLAKQEAGMEQLRRDGIIPGDGLVVDQIRKIPALQSAFNPVTGKFDKAAYAQVLNQLQLTEDTFQGEVRDETASDQLSAGFAAGMRPPRLLAAAFSDFEFENHQLSVFVIDPKTLGAPPTPTDDQLKALMTANVAALTTPETRQFTVVTFSAKALAPTITADPAEVKKRYDFRKDTLSTPEKRTVVQVPAKTAADAQAIAAKLAQGQEPAAVAKAAGVQAVNFNDQPKSGISDPKVADVAFSLAEGKTSGPIQGQLGLAVIKVLKVTAGHEVSFEEARPKIEDEVKTEAAANKAYQLTQKYEDAHDKGANIVDAAKAAGLTTTQVGPVTASGTDPDGKPGGVPPNVLKEGFDLTSGAESDIVQDKTAKGEYFVVRADKVLPPAPPTLDKVRPRLTQYFQQVELQKRLSAKLDGLAAQVKKGQTMDQVAASVGAKVQQMQMTRAQAQRAQNMRPEQLERIFQAKAGDVFTSGAAVVKITAISPPAIALAAQAINSAQGQVARQIFEELNEEARTYAQTLLKPKTNLALARQAIGLSPDTPLPGAAPKPGSPSPAGRAQ